ncbi:MAG: S8 family serine peptidase [Candidatus Polarisedimenticolia bacterium]
MRPLLPRVAAVLLAVTALSALERQVRPRGHARLAPHVPGEILIKLRSSTEASARAQLQFAWRATPRRIFRSGAQHWRLDGGESVEEAVARLRDDPRVAWVEPNYIVRIDTAPGDPRYPELWGLNNTGQDGGEPGADIDAERAWDITTGSRAVRVAVIDTGVDYEHPDLSANIWTNPGEVPGNGLDDDGNGFMDDVHGYDFANDDPDPRDDHGHGSHVAGTIGAVGNNGIGVAGVCWQVSLVPVKFLSSAGTGTTDDAIAAVEYATVLGVDVMNNSWGGGFFSEALAEAIQEASDAGILFVAAAGNTAEDADVFPHYPASYDLPNVVSVAASDHLDDLAFFSNYGATSVDLAAPGLFILSTWRGGYERLSGTSMAAPHVSGVAALIRAAAPGATLATVRSRLMEMAEPVPALEGKTVTGGRLNAFRILADRDATPPGPVADLRVDEAFSNGARLAWVAPGDDGGSGRASGYDLRVSVTPLDEGNVGSSPRRSAPAPLEGGSTQVFEVAGLDAGTTYHAALRAVDEWGNEGPVAFLSFSTLPPPVFASSPSSWSLEVPFGGIAATTLLVENAGPGSLDWSIDVPSPPGEGPALLVAGLDLGKGDPDPRRGDLAVSAAGGPDRFGYTFADSTDPNGPAFTWVDISATGTPLAALTGDDEVSPPIPLPFSFPFYGRLHDAVRVSTNGWISFAPAGPFPANQPLPAAQAPAAMVAPFWDDLDFQGAARVRYVAGPHELVVQYTDVGRYNAAGRFTFQVRLRDSGEILFLYHTLDGESDGATVGIQDTAVDGLQAAFNSPYLIERLALRWRASPTWWTASPAAGRLAAGEHRMVAVEIDASGLPAGRHESSLLVRTNDPLRPAVPHPLALLVTGTPALEVSPDPIDFGEVPAGLASTVLLTLHNGGTGPVELSAITPGDSSLSISPASLVIPPGGTRTLEIAWAPPESGPLDTFVRLDGPSAAAEVRAVGRAVPSAELRAEPPALAVTLAGGSAARRIRLTNTTAETLHVAITPDPGTAPDRAPPETAGSSAASARPERPASAHDAPRRAPYPPMPTAPKTDRTKEPAAVPSLTGAFDNGGFELGNFTGWTAATTGFISWRASRADFGFFGNSDPLEGTFDALNEFDGEAGTRFTLSREIDVPAVLARATLSWWDRIQFDGYGHDSRLPRVYEATLQDAEGRRLALIVRQEILLHGSPYQDLGWIRRSVDLTPYAGRSVRLVIEESVPETWTGPAQIEFDDFRLDIVPMPSWLRVSPGSAAIPAGGTLDLEVTLDASAAPSGRYRGAVRLGIQERPGVPIGLPVTLTSLAVPALVVRGGMVHVESVIPYVVEGATTRHRLVLPVPPAGDGRITLSAEGDYGDYHSEFAGLSLEGRFLGSVGGIILDCAPAVDVFPLDAALLQSVAADGVAEAEVSNDSEVGAFCATNQHRVRLSYRATADRLEFGTVMAGLSGQRSLELANEGEAPLIVRLETGAPEFFVDGGPLVIPPGGSALAKMTFAPAEGGDRAAALRLITDDPAAPLVEVPLLGTGREPPVMSVSPSSLSATLLPGAAVTRIVTVDNAGGSSLQVSAAVRTTARPAASGMTSCAPRRLVMSEPGRGALVALDLSTLETSRVALSLSKPGVGISLSRDGRTAWVTETESGELSAVDLTTGEITRIAQGLGLPTGLAVAPDGVSAYVTSMDGRLRRVRLDTGEVSLVSLDLQSARGLALSPDGTTAWVLEESGPSLVKVDLATGAVSLVLDKLSGEDVAIDETQTTAYVAGIDSVVAIDLRDGNAREIATGLSRASGIALAGEDLYVVEGGGGRVALIDRFTGEVTYLAAALSAPRGAALDGSCDRFAAIEPSSAVIPPGASLSFQLRLDAEGLAAGLHEGELELVGDDPFRPRQVIPLALEVLAAPDIELRSEAVSVTSAADYEGSAAITTHELRLSTAPAGVVTLDLEAEGDFGDEFEAATARSGGRVLGSTGSVGNDCRPAHFRQVLSPADLAMRAPDGVLSVQVANTESVGSFCGVNRHTVSLSYEGAADRLDFGAVAVGVSGRRSLIVRNRGAETLHVDLDAGSGPIQPAAAALTVPPRAETALEVGFVPSQPGHVDAVMTLRTDDPDEPVFLIPMQGDGVAPPRLRVEPESLDLTVRSGTRMSLPIRLVNEGASPLTFTLTSAARPGADPAAAGGPSALEVSIPREGAVTRPLAASPAPLAWTLADPASGAIYAMESNGTGLYRYDPRDDSWRTLEPAPIRGTRGGAALLNGRIYATLSPEETSVLAVYTLASGTWSTLPNPLRGASAIASDGRRFLYLALGNQLLRLDPLTMAVQPLAPPPFSFFTGTLQFLDGRLYGHQGAGARGFATFDPASGFWSLLPSVPESAHQAAVVDPVERAYHVLAFDGRSVFRFDTRASTWSLSELPFSTPRAFGGMAWVAAPAPALCIPGGNSETTFLAAFTKPLVDAPPVSGVIPPGDSAVVEAVLDASRFPSGDYRSVIDVESGDPLRPRAAVPIDVRVDGVPELRVTGPASRAFSFLNVPSNGTTVHRFAVDPRLSGDATLEVLAQGSFQSPFQLAWVSLEGTTLGWLGLSSDPCAAGKVFVVPRELLAAAAADGAVDFTVTNTSTFPTTCPLRRHSLSLTWPGAADALSFGEVPLGQIASRSLDVSNTGMAPLSVSLDAGPPPFVVAPAGLVLGPGESERIAVTFRPQARGTAAATLRVVSNDPEQGPIQVGLAGTGFELQRAVLEPPRVDVALPPGGKALRTLRLGNAGQRPLTWSLIPRFAPAQGSPPAGGPDAGGYSFRDSDDPRGPAFQWIDISQTGSSLPIFLDDQISGAIPLGFSFPFYDRSFTSVRVCTNGFLSFTSLHAPRGSGIALPSAESGVPENLIAPLWVDMDFLEARRARYHSGPDRFVVQYNDVPLKDLPESRLTFQVILEPTGKITFQYLSLSHAPAATIGIQNDSRTVGLSASPSLLRDGVALAFERARWFAAGDRSGEVAGDGAHDIGLGFDATGLPDGDYDVRLSFTTNDPVRPVFDLPVRLHVGEAAATLLEMHPAQLNLKSNGQTVKAILQLPPALDPRRVVVSSLTLQGLQALALPAEYTDGDGDGVEEINVKFDRAALQEILAPGDNAVEITGEVQDVSWFRGTTILRVSHPRLTHPRGGEILQGGAPVTVTWDPVPLAPPVTYLLELSVDDGVTWSPLTPAPVQGSSFTWVPALAGPRALLRLTAFENGSAEGQDRTDAPFAIVPPQGGRVLSRPSDRESPGVD